MLATRLSTRSAARRSMRRSGPLAAAVGVLTLGLALSGCGPSGSVAKGSETPPVAVSRAPATRPSLVLPTIAAAFDKPLSLSIANGTLREVLVTGTKHGTPLTGSIDAGKTAWSSDVLPQASAGYKVAVTALDADGTSQQLSGTVTVAAVPASRSLAATLTPFGGTVGVGAPVVLRFTKDVSDRAAVEKLVRVASSVPLRGGFRWVSDSELHFRPESYWPSGTTVEVSLPLAGKAIGADQWGIRDSTVRFQIGQKRVSRVDGAAHTMSLSVADKTVASWPTSLGKPEFQTRTGTYVVLGKQESLQMTSCSAQITCDKKDPNYYDLKVDWDVRLTYSGTFVHAAPWSQAHQGRDNVSHGCINLSEAHAKAYFEQSHYGDVVVVTGTGRGPADLLRSGDPGMADWNMPLSTYVSRSATGAPISTEAL